MEESLKPVAEQVAFNSSLLAHAFAGLTEEQASRSPSGAANSIKWLFGHVVTSRSHMLGLLGVSASAPWNNVFEGDIPKGTQLPSMAAIEQKSEATARKLLQALAVADARQLRTAPATPFPTVENTTLAALAFLANHEGYHIGQISYARRVLGLPGLVAEFMATQ